MIKKPVDISIPIRPISLGSVVSYLLYSSPPIGLSVCVYVCGSGGALAPYGRSLTVTD